MPPWDSIFHIIFEFDAVSTHTITYQYRYFTSSSGPALDNIAFGKCAKAPSSICPTVAGHTPPHQHQTPTKKSLPGSSSKPSSGNPMTSSRYTRAHQHEAPTKKSMPGSLAKSSSGSPITSGWDTPPPQHQTSSRKSKTSSREPSTLCSQGNSSTVLGSSSKSSSGNR